MSAFCAVVHFSVNSFLLIYREFNCVCFIVNVNLHKYIYPIYHTKERPKTNAKNPVVVDSFNAAAFSLTTTAASTALASAATLAAAAFSAAAAAAAAGGVGVVVLADH